MSKWLDKALANMVYHNANIGDNPHSACQSGLFHRTVDIQHFRPYPGCLAGNNRWLHHDADAVTVAADDPALGVPDINLDIRTLHEPYTPQEMARL